MLQGYYHIFNIYFWYNFCHWPTFSQLTNSLRANVYKSQLMIARGRALRKKILLGLINFNLWTCTLSLLWHCQSSFELLWNALNINHVINVDILLIYSIRKHYIYISDEYIGVYYDNHQSFNDGTVSTKIYHSCLCFQVHQNKNFLSVDT